MARGTKIGVAAAVTALAVAASLLAPGGGGAMAEAAPADPKPLESYDALLKQYVDAQGWVDYAGWKQRDEPTLRRAVSGFAAQDPASMTPTARKAYWINVYNALTLQAMLEFFPLDSIKDKQSTFGFKVWDDYTFGPRQVSLNDIEHKILRPLGDPRIHGAIVCASRGCPPLRNEAYRAEQLDAQLDDQCRTWLRDRTRGLKIEGETAYVSKVFDWFASDFPDGEQGRLSWIARFATPADAAKLRSGELELDTLDWDWALNRQ